MESQSQSQSDEERVGDGDYYYEEYENPHYHEDGRRDGDGDGKRDGDGDGERDGARGYAEDYGSYEHDSLDENPEHSMTIGKTLEEIDEEIRALELEAMQANTQGDAEAEQEGQGSFGGEGEGEGEGEDEDKGEGEEGREVTRIQLREASTRGSSQGGDEMDFLQRQGVAPTGHQGVGVNPQLFQGVQQVTINNFTQPVNQNFSSTETTNTSNNTFTQSEGEDSRDIRHRGRDRDRDRDREEGEDDDEVGSDVVPASRSSYGHGRQKTTQEERGRMVSTSRGGGRMTHSGRYSSPRKRRDSADSVFEDIHYLAVEKARSEERSILTAVKASVVFALAMVGEALFVMLRDWLDTTQTRPQRLPSLVEEDEEDQFFSTSASHTHDSNNNGDNENNNNKKKNNNALFATGATESTAMHMHDDRDRDSDSDLLAVARGKGKSGRMTKEEEADTLDDDDEEDYRSLLSQSASQGTSSMKHGQEQEHEQASQRRDRLMQLHAREERMAYISRTKSVKNLVSDMQYEGDMSHAEALARNTLKTRRIMYGTNHGAVAQSLNQLAGILAEKGEIDEAEELYEEALKVCRIYYGDDSKREAVILHNLGCLELAKKQDGDAQAALNYGERAISIAEATFGASAEVTSRWKQCWGKEVTPQKKNRAQALVSSLSFVADRMLSKGASFMSREDLNNSHESSKEGSGGESDGKSSGTNRKKGKAR